MGTEQRQSRTPSTQVYEVPGVQEPSMCLWSGQLQVRGLVCIRPVSLIAGQEVSLRLTL